ncbi:Cap15 family cyclic dinucleotide receptor domain-containing protein [Micromonospora chersina]|uniref:Cap15 family cyclic dinucleotide receptor domain-containing protein n=1 Tax=Micromonospora chersina TaxID=47854 RepID=UPI00371F9512
MHPYSHDSSRTRTLILFLAVAAILLAWGLGRVLRGLDVTPPWWLDTPAVVGLYGILWQLYDRRLWRLRVGDQTLSGIPDYNGAWGGWVHSSHDGAKRYAARLTIRQTSSRILVELRTDGSRSVSHMAMLCAGPGSAEGLQYIYANWPIHVPLPATTTPQPDHPAVLAMHPHQGVSRLLLRPDGTLEGDYQTDRHRGTHGTLSFGEKVAP